ncbi:MAG: CheR family methyltransferase [Christensenellales bacterium]|jgi:chemotaxis protein methyltransferase CheR
MIRIKDSEFELLTDYLSSNFGINMKAKRTLIEARLNNYLHGRGFECYSSYLNDVFEDRSGEEASQLINRLSTNYSYFMREPEQLGFFMSEVLPRLISSIPDKDLRIWSAGCSTGEEPYTLAMIINDVLCEAGALWDKKILATDISRKALQGAALGIYGAEALERLPEKWVKRYFKKVGDAYHISAALKKEIVLRRFNLNDSVYPFRKPFHAIFCRNVMIYFGKEEKRRLIKKLYAALAKGGYLFLGQSETLDRAESGFAFIRPSVFQKQE